jgi:hypothetical protein
MLFLSVVAASTASIRQKKTAGPFGAAARDFSDKLA